jgi:lactoylglutathione lyase
MNAISLNLVVLRVPDIERAAVFYSVLGLEFTKHAHGKGPEHYAAELGGVIFELYPLTSDGESMKSVRLGFRVEQASDLIVRLEAGGGTIITPLRESPWGRRGVVDDPFGHRIEIVESTPASRGE